jgi:glutamate 5-kinase
MTVVVKVGSSSLTTRDGALDQRALESLVAQLAGLSGRGDRCLLVSSGAIAAGRHAMGLGAGGAREMDVLQGLAAVGQGVLMSEYSRRFHEHHTHVAQVLLTARDFGERATYLNARRTLSRLLEWQVIPVINENDTVATDEITFGENDRLSALVATMVGADLLLMLTDTPGMLSSDPRLSADATLVDEVTDFDAALAVASAGGPGSLGSGGMASKIAAARIAAWSGIPCVIAAATEANVIARAVAGDAVGTRVPARAGRMAARKVWIAFAQAPRGRLQVDDGAVEAICRGGRSLLPVGIRTVEGQFDSGDAVEIVDPRGMVVAKGLVRSSAEQLRKGTAGLGLDRTSAAAVPGELPASPRAAGGETAVHRDDLVVLAS